MHSPKQSWLMVIDHQPAFAHPRSPWFSPMMAEATRRIEALVPLFANRVLFTRFVPPADITGSWRPYYDRWDFATKPSADWLWPVSEPWSDRPSIASHTFAKWTAEARAFFGPEPQVTMCGVATDCCVLGTALAAIDDGALVRVASDACAARSAEVHQQALGIMALRAPQLSIVTTEDEVRRMAAPAGDI